VEKRGVGVKRAGSGQGYTMGEVAIFLPDRILRKIKEGVSQLGGRLGERGGGERKVGNQEKEVWGENYLYDNNN